MFQILVDSIMNELGSKFEKDLFTASINFLNDKNNPIRYNSFAFSIRELIRHIFERLAPDKRVLKCKWYTNETDKPNGITRKQRMMYAIKGGLSDEFIHDVLESDLDDISHRMKIVINNINKYTHIQEETFNCDSQVINDMVIMALKSLDDFFDTIKNLKREISKTYESYLYMVITETMISDTFNEIDELATHYWVDEVRIGNISINGIDESIIYIVISGSVEIVHQYGSDADFRHGDGLRMEAAYPYNISLEIDVEEPLEITLLVDDIEIDNSKFYE